MLLVFKVFNKLDNDEEESAILIDDYSQSIEYTKFTNDILNFRNHIKQNKYADYYMKKIEKTTYSVALHVRRGDYLLKENKENFGVCPLAYYQKAKQYIDEYLEQYSGIKNFMENITEEAKEQGYVETLFHRRRYIPELKSNNYMVRQFGARVAMNTPIQGTAADIMKIAMVNLYKELNKNNLQSKILLQIHDELLLQVKCNEKEKVESLLKSSMENAIQLKVPLKVELSEASNWYEAK